MIFYAYTSGWDSFRFQYKVPMYRDIIFWGTNRLILVVGAMMMLFTILIGNLNLFATVLIGDYTRSLSKISYPSGLMTGIIATGVLCGQGEGLYFINQISLGVAFGLMVGSIIIGMLIFIFIEYPVNMLVH